MNDKHLHIDFLIQGLSIIILTITTILLGLTSGNTNSSLKDVGRLQVVHAFQLAALDQATVRHFESAGDKKLAEKHWQYANSSMIYYARMAEWYENNYGEDVPSLDEQRVIVEAMTKLVKETVE